MNKNGKILKFPKPPPKCAAAIVIFQLGDDRVAIRWEIELLSPPAPVLSLKSAAPKANATIVK